MDHDDEPRRPPRETLLTLMLTALFGGAFLFFLIIVGGTVFLYVLIAVAAIAAVGLVHYVLWGQALSREVAGEREEAEARARQEADEQFTAEPYRPRRF